MMRAVVQRVDRASVSVNCKRISSIDKGIIVFLGVEKGDGRIDADYILEKVVNLRIFEDEVGKMNLSVLDTEGAIMIISQFTLLGDCRKGRRPSFINAEEPEPAKDLYDYFVHRGLEKARHVAAGEFQAMMTIDVVNNGPVTLLLSSKREF
jgi:D-tyrosyl-tRNA(Tyr) deacylase